MRRRPVHRPRRNAGRVGSRETGKPIHALLTKADKLTATIARTRCARPASDWRSCRRSTRRNCSRRSTRRASTKPIGACSICWASRRRSRPSRIGSRCRSSGQKKPRRKGNDTGVITPYCQGTRSGRRSGGWCEPSGSYERAVRQKFARSARSACNKKRTSSSTDRNAMKPKDNIAGFDTDAWASSSPTALTHRPRRIATRRLLATPDARASRDGRRPDLSGLRAGRPPGALRDRLDARRRTRVARPVAADCRRDDEARHSGPRAVPRDRPAAEDPRRPQVPRTPTA